MFSKSIITIKPTFDIPASEQLTLAEEFPTGLDVWHLPNPSAAIRNGPSGCAYSHVYRT